MPTKKAAKPLTDEDKQRLKAEKNSAKCKRWREKHLDYDKQRHHRIFQENRDEILARMRRYNRARGHPEKPKGPKAQLEIEVPVTRRWRCFTGPDGVTRLYFSTKKGFELSELVEIMREFKATRKHFLERQINP